MFHRILCTTLCACGIILSGIATSSGAEIPWKIDKEAAEILAAEGRYGAAAQGVTSFDFSYQETDPPFFVFDLLGKSGGSVGYFAVNPWTGDVWNLWHCERLSTAALRKSQAEIRLRFTKGELKQYARLRRLKPECT